MCIKILRNPQDTDYAVESMPFFDGWMAQRRYIAAISQGRIVGLLCHTDHREGVMVMTYLSVAQAWRGQGVATRLARVFLEEARSRGVVAGITAYEELGQQYLKPVLHRFAQAGDIELFEDWTPGRWSLHALRQDLVAA